MLQKDSDASGGGSDKLQIRSTVLKRLKSKHVFILNTTISSLFFLDDQQRPYDDDDADAVNLEPL